MAVRESRPLPQHVPAQCPGLDVLPLLHELVEALVRAEERDQVLGVFLAPVEAVGRGVTAPAQVAERGQALSGSLIEGRRFRGRSGSAAGRGQDLDEGPTEGIRLHRFSLEEVHGFLGVASEVVELGAGRFDVLPAVHDDAEQGAGAVVAGGGHGLRIEGSGSPARAPSGEPGREIHSLHSLGNLRPHQGEDRGHDVDEAHGEIDLTCGGLRAGHPHDERHAKGTLVDEEPVVQLAVLAEHLPVVPGDDDEGRVVEAELPELLHDLAHAVVRERDLALVGLPLPLGSEGLGRLVGVVGVVEVDEEEEGPVLVLVQPLPREAGRLVPLALAQVADLVDGLEAVVVAVEALADAELPVENERADDGPGREASRLEHLGQGQASLGQPVQEVVAQPVSGRQGPREHGDVGGQGHGHRSVDVLEQHAFPGHRIDVRRGRPWEAIGAHMVRPQGVDADQEDVADGRPRLGAGGEEAGNDQEAENDEDGRARNPTASTTGSRIHALDASLSPETNRGLTARPTEEELGSSSAV